MSELQISSIKYPALEKLKTLGNNADGVEPLLKILPTYEALANAAVQEHIMSTEEIEEVVQKDTKNVSTKKDKSNRPFFTDENGKAMQAVRVMQKANEESNLEEYER